MWLLWLFLGMFMGWLTLGLFIPFLKSLTVQLIQDWTQSITHHSPKLKTTKTEKPPKPAPEPTFKNGAVNFESDEEFRQWKQEHNINVEEN